MLSKVRLKQTLCIYEPWKHPGHAIKIVYKPNSSRQLLPQVRRFPWWILLAPGACSHCHVLKCVKPTLTHPSPMCPSNRTLVQWPPCKEAARCQGNHSRITLLLSEGLVKAEKSRSRLSLSKEKVRMTFSLSPLTGLRVEQINLGYKIVPEPWRP